MTSQGVVQGVFAVNKPTSVSSAQVIRDIQQHFKPSDLFRPWLEEETARLRDARKSMYKGKFRKSRRPVDVKMGHGGTLDPMATGVLVIGVGSGTKRLGDFQKDCTKSYDTVLLFGQATDTYDVVGKTVARKAYDHITRDMVEKALDKFRGDIMQRPPIYSALRVQGKRLYEYAREGKEVPVEIQQRPVRVENIELVEWFAGGSHPYHWPKDEADSATKEVAEKVLHIEPQSGVKRARETSAQPEQSSKRSKTGDENSTEHERATKNVETSADERAEGALAPIDVQVISSDQEPCPAPACRIRMTVTSGFYVRSLCHDLGEAVDSLGTMASLVRTRQGEFELGKNVFDLAELEKGEPVWAPQIRKLLLESTGATKDVN